MKKSSHTPLYRFGCARKNYPQPLKPLRHLNIFKQILGEEQ